MRFIWNTMCLMCLLGGTIFPQSQPRNPQSQIPNPTLQDSPDQLFQAGLYAEEVQGDLHEALEIYQKIVKDYPDQRPVAAKAQLHIGLCHEKLGQQQAQTAYQKVLENYPDQREAVAVAKERLAHLKKTAISPLVKYYFERFGVDITTSTSYDGKYLAYTDWTTGSLMISDLGLRISDDRLRNPHSEIRNQKSAIRIVEANFSHSLEFAYHPAWSRDGKFIAYSWYRGPYFVELRVVSVVDGKIDILYSDSKLMILPSDWSADGKTIVCETLDFQREAFKWLALARTDSNELHEVLPLDGNARGMKFSPDGKYVAYDFQDGVRRQLYVFTMKESLQNKLLNVEFPFLDGVDGPVWSAEGNLVLCRTIVQNGLWAIPVSQGKAAAKPNLVQTDLTNALLIMKGIKRPALAGTNRAVNKKADVPNSRNSVRSFVEEFTSPELDSAWSVFEWKGPNIYDYSSFGRYSLTDHQGYLRYYSDPMMQPAFENGYAPYFSGWYWFYPSLEISRPLAGNRWKLEAKATYSMVDGANGRGFSMTVCFGPERDPQTVLLVGRSKDIRKESNQLFFRLLDRGVSVNESINCASPRDTLGVSKFTYVYRITRADTLIQVELSDDDGKNFQQVFSASLRPELRSLAQSIAFTGDSWFVPAGAYADWDYVRFRNLDF